MLSEHYYYTTALVLLSQFLQGALPRSLLLGLPVRAMYLALSSGRAPPNCRRTARRRW